MSNKLLTITIPSVVSREKYLNRLLLSLQKQIIDNNLENDIEILIFKDDLTNKLGYKCNELVKNSKGKYVVGIGDDDMVADNYCYEIINVLKTQNVDQVTFNMVYNDINKGNKLKMKFSKNFSYFNFILNKHLKIKFLKYSKKEGEEVYLSNKLIFQTEGKLFKTLLFIIFLKLITRFVKHSECYTWTTMVIKKEIASKIKFTNRDNEEDMEWAIKACEQNLIKTECNLNKDLYYYNYDHEMSIDNDKGEHHIKTKDINHEIKEITLKNIRWL